MNFKSYFTLAAFTLVFVSATALRAQSGPDVAAPVLDQAVQALSRYIQIPSLSGREAAAGRFFADLCASKGLHVHFMGEEDGRFNFAASLYPLDLGKPNVLFLNHIDVVEAEGPGWTHPPFGGEVAEGRVWGRGAFDNKGAAIMHLFAIASLTERAKSEDLPFNVSLLAVSCEEGTCTGGAQYVAENFLDILNPVVVFGEGPPSLDGIVPSHPEQQLFAISLAHKRPFWLKLYAQIPCLGHGSVTPLEYANKEMARALHRLASWKPKLHFNVHNRRMLKDLGRMEKGIAGFFLKNNRWARPLIVPALRKEPALAALFTDNITLTGFQSGGEHTINSIPQECAAFLDCRLLPDSDRDRFLKRLKKRIRSEAIQVEVLLEMPGVTPSEPDNPFYRAMHESISTYYPEAEVIPIILPNYTDDGWFRAAGIPCYSSLPVFLARSSLEAVHGEDEHLPIQALEDGITVFSRLLHRIMTFPRG